MKKYPKITSKNFEKFVKEHVIGSHSTSTRFRNIDLPSNEQEFRQFTKNIYGVELSVKCVAHGNGEPDSKGMFYIDYEIQGMDESEYSKNPIYKLWDRKFGQYDGLKVLLNSLFGSIRCGGVARYHYAQASTSDKSVWERITNWDNRNAEKQIEKAIEQHDSLVDIFGFNPFLNLKSL